MTEILVEVAKPMVEMLVRRGLEETHWLRHLNKELNNLVDKIRIMASIVDNITEVADAAVGVWLKNALHIICDAENLLDVLAYEKQRRLVIKRTRRIRFIFRRVYLNTKMSSWIRRITFNFEDAVKQAHAIAQLRALAHSASAQPTARKLNNNDYELLQIRRHVDMSLFIGRDSDVLSVVRMLCNPPQHSHNHRLSVVAIVGFGGMGKSSLAKQVYNNESVKIHFGERIWIPDLKDFDIRKTLNKMVEFLGRSNSENASTETTIRKLQECLRGKSYLLVLDDVWNTNQQCWDLMRYELERVGGSMESMVLVTTRDDVVAKAMHASSVHYLSGLSKDDSWALFNQIAFVNRPIRDVFALEVSGRKIVEKCKGVPLAIKSIGGLLQGKEKPYEWTIIEESELWDIPHLETGILPSLKLSYNHLSSPLLKKCFSLCALWPKGSCFEKYDFIHRWIALGLIQKHNNENMTMEDIGESYLNELLSLSFLFVDKRNELGEAIEYSLHDLVYDLARSVASCERLYLEASKKVNNVPHIQHLTVVGHAELTSVFPDKLVLEKIRSLDSVENLPRGLLRHVKYLRVLSLLRSNVEKLPEMIGKLKCLKFLDMTENPIKVLPQSILELYSLQSLILYRCQQLVKLPRGQLSNLANLRHLCLSFSFCPEGLGECTSLRILSISCCKKLSSLPSNLSKLVSLEEFGIWFCPNLVSIPNVSGLGSMQKFMMVRNDGLRKVPEGLQSCKSVDKLWVNACEKVDTLLDLEGLSRLSNLGIIGTTKMIRQPPDWLFILSCLRILHIGEYRELNEFPDLSPLLRLTFLEILYVYGWKPLQSVPEQLQHFTKLRGLGIVDFDYLEHLPDWLRHLSSLQYLYPIKGCHGPTHLVGN